MKPLMKKIVLIQNEFEYQAALIEASAFFDNEPSPGSQDAIRFESLLKSIVTYESKNYAIN